MKKITILTVALVLAVSGMAAAGDISRDTGDKPSSGIMPICVGPIGLLSSLMGLSCGPDRLDDGIDKSTGNLSSDSRKPRRSAHAPEKSPLPPEIQPPTRRRSTRD